MKILIWGEPKNGGPYDIFRSLDYHNIYRELVDNYHANSINIGNKVWIQGIVSALSTPENELFFLNPKESWDEINSKYDKIVYSAANMLCQHYLALIDSVATMFRKSKIPVYVISIGAQACRYEDVDQLVKSTSKSVSHFMESIYLTGGEIACRGYFTKEYLDKIATNTAVVTGCPSLFQNGRNLKIQKKDDYFLPVFNGNAPFDKLLNKYNNSAYIDQDLFLNLFYDLKEYNPTRYLANNISKYGKEAVSQYLNGRIKFFYDMPEWRTFLQNKKINFSIGSRIHGTIMSLLSGIPSVICPIDTRTREMAEFYNIPTIKSCDEYNDIEKVFEKIEFDEFNTKYPKLFDSYDAFLRKCGLVREVNQKNFFWEKRLPQNKNILDEKRKKLKKYFNEASFGERMYFKLSEIFPAIAKLQETERRDIVEMYDERD